MALRVFTNSLEYLPNSTESPQPSNAIESRSSAKSKQDKSISFALGDYLDRRSSRRYFYDCILGDVWNLPLGLHKVFAVCVQIVNRIQFKWKFTLGSDWTCP
jgi:hypothetical protein